MNSIMVLSFSKYGLIQQKWNLFISRFNSYKYFQTTLYASGNAKKLIALKGNRMEI